MFYLAEPGYQVDEGDGFLEVKVRKIGTDLSQPSKPVPSLQKLENICNRYRSLERPGFMNGPDENPPMNERGGQKPSNEKKQGGQKPSHEKNGTGQKPSREI
ncbi:hypothetical protein DPMN_106509 [Dreissena polymorpha]|uniref:Uncharacterized protein n=1 Tax=Dreissena polymorpha TaxID=45954 RepID=A0A9D4QIW4_DREPO|nr:hypothetical protein DPMN_106509 [Dreissena polymorpha]